MTKVTSATVSDCRKNWADTASLKPKKGVLKNMLKIFKHLDKKYLAHILCGIGFISLAVYLELSIPGYMREITLLVQMPGAEVREIWEQGGLMLLTAFGALAATILAGWCAGRLGAGFARDLRVKVFSKVLDFSQAEINKFSVPSLITRQTRDIANINQVIVMGFIMLIRAPIMAVWATTKIFDQGLDWAIATMIAVGILLIVITILVIFALPKFKILPKLTDRLNQIAREHLTGIRVTKAYNAHEYEAEKFQTANTHFMKTSRFAERTMAILWPTVTIIMYALPLVIYLIGARLINNALTGADLEAAGELFASMVVFAQYALQVVMAFLMMSMMMMFMPQAVVSANRINEVLETEKSLTYPEIDFSATVSSKTAFELSNVYFKYPEADDYVLEDLSFTVENGETVAIIGATGSGKSTLLKLLTRGYDASSGDVMLNGTNIKHYSEKQIADKIGYVLQKASLLSGSIKSNIAFGQREASITDVTEAARLAQASDFIEKLEDNYESNITQGATNVSGGQKQRLSIARTLYRNADILIFDDSFSALDYKTDRNLRKALNESRKDVTKIIVAQRVSTIKNADKIIVLDEGKIAGIGRHNELLMGCHVYQEIAKSQLTEEELRHG